MLELLPEDVLIIILKELDFHSQANLYEVSDRIKRIFMGYKVTKECNISFSTIATAKTLQTNFFKVIAPNLLKLDLSAVNDITKSSLIPIMGKLKHLQTLDVSYTKINLKDFINIYKVCPTIKNITMQFNFGPKIPDTVPMSTILECQKIFKNFERIHFYGTSSNLMISPIIQIMLQLSNLKILQYTITEGSGDITYDNECYGKYRLNCNHFFINCPWGTLYSFPFNVVEEESYEYLIIYSSLKYWDVYGSPMFNDFFKEKYGTKVNNSFGSGNFNFEGNSCIMVWMKSLQTFDEEFFNSLHRTLRNILVCFTLDTWSSNTISKYDTFCITPRERENSNKPSSVEFGFKRKRIVSQNHILDYDSDFRDKKEIELNLMFSLYVLKAAVTLNSNCEYLKKLTYLNLIGAEKYSATFFNILFRSCVKLVTLNVAMDNLNANDVARSASLSHSIKNLRIVAKMIDFNSVLRSLSQCSTLENVHLVDRSSASPSTLFDPSPMIQKCTNLYCVHIFDSKLSESKQVKQMKIIESAKNKFHKPQLSFKVLAKVRNPVSFYEFKPYVDVFRLNQIKVIKLF